MSLIGRREYRVVSIAAREYRVTIEMLIDTLHRYIHVNLHLVSRVKMDGYFCLLNLEFGTQTRS